MRKIKFRAWDDEDNCMVYGLEAITELYDTFKYHLNDIDELPIMQFTGLTDRKGVEIYEGDILEIYNWGQTSREKLGVVAIEWDKQSAAWEYTPNEWADDRYDMFRNVEVIGNIYENGDPIK